MYTIKLTTMKAKQFYNNIQEMQLIATCVSSTIYEWDEYMKNSVKADANIVEKLIKKLLPDLWEELNLNYYNPFRYQCRRKKGLIIYCHSAVEYFIQVY